MFSHEKNRPYFKVISKKREADITKRQKRLWCNRDRIVTGADTRNLRDIFQKCNDEIEQMSKPVVIDREGIIERFLREKERKSKKKKAK